MGTVVDDSRNSVYGVKLPRKYRVDTFSEGGALTGHLGFPRDGRSVTGAIEYVMF